jgi:hypothetical protein
MSATVNPPPAPPVQSDSTTWFSRIFELTARVGTSWFGLVAGYFATLLSAVLAYQKLEGPLKGTRPWVRPAFALSSVVAVLLFHTLPASIDQWRRRRLKEISGELKPGYFRLAPREDEKDFARADNKHEEVLSWLKDWREPVVYLTGQSGSGKSSILAAWVIPRLSKDDPPVKVIQLRGYQDPLSMLTSKMREALELNRSCQDILEVLGVFTLPAEASDSKQTGE